MSRIEGKIGDEDGQPVDAAEILAALARDKRSDGRRRKGAVSCYLSASEGWRQAAALLGGAFAPRESWLRSDKEE